MMIPDSGLLSLGYPVYYKTKFVNYFHETFITK